MTREEKCLTAIQLGYTYNPETGEVKNRQGKVLKSKTPYGYLVIGRKELTLFQHQFAWYFIHKETVNSLDHINGIKDDNRISNLRSVTHQQNHFNETKAKGYYWHKGTNKWQTKIMLNGKSIHLGLFNTEEEARQTYLKAKEQYHII
jgi:hypothetical protein